MEFGESEIREKADTDRIEVSSGSVSSGILSSREERGFLVVEFPNKPIIFADHCVACGRMRGCKRALDQRDGGRVRGSVCS